MKVACITDIGERRENEDTIYIPENGAKPVYIVSDGMGGHQAGATASRLATASVVEYVEQYKGDYIDEELKIATAYANARVIAASNSDKAYAGMGTTLSIVYIGEGKFYTANVGDSRVYLYTGDELIQITRDHSYVAELVRAGEITAKQARSHPQRNLITRAIGIKETEVADIDISSWQRGDMILICSDGLYDGAEDETIFDILHNMNSETDEDLAHMCQELVYAAREGKSGDNISIILIKYEEGDE